MTDQLGIHELGLTGGTLTDFAECWEHQQQLHARVSTGEIPGQVLLVEHAPVFTAGRRTVRAEMPQDGTPVVPVDRGGKITYHGPGQLVGYPIVRLPDSARVVDYVRRLEEAVICWLDGIGVRAGLVEGRTGVWVPADERGPERKICAIGIRVRQRTTLHGFALNLDPDMSRFGTIIPCGISDAGVTSVAAELGSAPSVHEAAEGMVPLLTDLLRFEPFTPLPPPAQRLAAACPGRG